MGAVRKADFYFGSMLSCLINNGLAPAIIEPGDSRRIYKLTTDNGDISFMQSTFLHHQGDRRRMPSYGNLSSRLMK